MTARPNLTSGLAPARPGIAMALYGDLTRDSRVIREADTLGAQGSSVRVYSLAGSPASERADLRRLCLDAAHQRWNWKTEGKSLLTLYRRLLPTVSDEAIA